MVEITTERLLVRPLETDDLKAFVAYRSDPDVRGISARRRYDGDASVAASDRCGASTAQVVKPGSKPVPSSRHR